MRYKNRYLGPNLNILINILNCSKKVSLLTASENAWKSRPRHFQLLSKSDLTLSKFHEPRSLWRWGSTRNRRINRFPATALAFYKTVPEQLSAWTIGTDHVIITERIFSPAEASPLESQVDFPHYTSERAPPVRPVLCEQNCMLFLYLRYYKCALCSVNRPAET